MKVWIVEGYGESNPEAYDLGPRETVGQLMDQFSRKLGVSRNEIEISTDTKRLNNESVIVSQVVKSGETLNIMPRAKAGVGC